jgi:hypothetical protein
MSWTNWFTLLVVSGGMPPDPLGRLRRSLGTHTFCEAEQRFLLLFLEKEEYHGPIGSLCGWLLGACPQTPWVGFAEVWVPIPSAKQNNAFCFFFWKKKNIMDQLVHSVVGFWGHAPRPPGSASPKSGSCCPLAIVGAFCFFFWKKKVTNALIVVHVGLAGICCVLPYSSRKPFFFSKEKK